MNTTRQPIFTRPRSLRDVPTHYCPGCGHGIVHRLLCEVIDELDIREKTIGVAPVGCAVLAYDYWNFDVTESPHGRTPAVATGLKRVHPDSVVFTYQGDGDLAAIGTSEIIHCANRGENITVLYVNNGVYGMTGGQMAPTTVPGQQTVTCPQGRSSYEGPPLAVTDIIASMEGPSFVARTKITSPAAIADTKQAIKKTFQAQIQGRGFSLVEILSMCPVYNGKTLANSIRHIDECATQTFPLGTLKEI